MSRSGYTDEYDNEGLLWLYRQTVKNAIEGKRGQMLLRDLVSALDAMPVKRLISAELEWDGEVCALGSLGRFRNMSMTNLDSFDHDEMAKAFDVSPTLAREVMYENDEAAFRLETPEQRWVRVRVRAWAFSQVKVTP